MINHDTYIFTGDTHGDHDWHKLTSKMFPEQKNLTKDDYVIITGDFGGVWDLGNTDKYIQKNYSQRNSLHSSLTAIMRTTMLWIPIPSKNVTEERFTRSLIPSST